MTAVLERVNTEALEQEGDVIMLELMLHDLMTDATLIREAAATKRFRSVLMRNMSMVEEAFDQLRAGLDVLNKDVPDVP